MLSNFAFSARGMYTKQLRATFAHDGIPDSQLFLRICQLGSVCPAPPLLSSAYSYGPYSYGLYSYGL